MHPSRPFQGLYSGPKSLETPTCPPVRTEARKNGFPVSNLQVSDFIQGQFIPGFIPRWSQPRRLASTGFPQFWTRPLAQKRLQAETRNMQTNVNRDGCRWVQTGVSFGQLKGSREGNLSGRCLPYSCSSQGRSSDHIHSLGFPPIPLIAGSGRGFFFRLTNFSRVRLLRLTMAAALSRVTY